MSTAQRIGTLACLLTLGTPAAETLAQSTPSSSGVCAPPSAPCAPAGAQSSTGALEKNFALAAGETILANFIPWIAVEYGLIWKDLTRMSPTSWLRNWNDWTFDDNHFEVNLLTHPIQGSFYHVAWRSNGYGYLEAMTGTAVGSFLWEVGGESHLPSWNDLVVTTLGGAALGEGLFRTGHQILAGGTTRRRELLAAIVGHPTQAFSRWVRGTLGEAPTSDVPAWSSTIGAGLRFDGGRDTHLRTDEDARGFLDISYGQGDVLQLKRTAAPFEYFRAGVEIAPSDHGLVSRARIRGSLGQFHTDCDGHWAARWILFQALDYQRNGSHQFGGQSLGAAWVVQGKFDDARQSELVLSMAGHLMGGGVRSEYARLATIQGHREREDREYDFAAGPGAAASIELLQNLQYRMGLSYRFDYLRTINGSNAGDLSSRHIVHTGEVRLNLPLAGPLGVGLDALLFKRASRFCGLDPDGPECRPEGMGWRGQYRIYLTFEKAATSSRLAVF